MTYVYVMGRGHSGSTVLDAMLGSTEPIESVGELSAMGKVDGKCSCSLSTRDCEYWTAVRKKFESLSSRSWQHAASIVATQAHVKSFLPTLMGRSRTKAELVEITKHLTSAVQEVSGKNVILDSSKNPTRALFLVLNFPSSKVIHLVRHPEGILASNYWRLKCGQGFQFLRYKSRNKRLTPFFLITSAIAWLAGNLLAEVVRICRPSQVFLLRYEDIGSDSEKLFHRLSAFLEVDVSQVATAIKNKGVMSFGHNIGGNYVRMQKTFIFEPKKGSEKSLPLLYRVVVLIVCWPLLIRYRYHLLDS
jgi:hypothetical protein